MVRCFKENYKCTQLTCSCPYTLAHRYFKFAIVQWITNQRNMSNCIHGCSKDSSSREMLCNVQRCMHIIHSIMKGLCIETHTHTHKYLFDARWNFKMAVALVQKIWLFGLKDCLRNNPNWNITVQKPKLPQNSMKQTPVQRMCTILWDIFHFR